MGRWMRGALGALLLAVALAAPALAEDPYWPPVPPPPPLDGMPSALADEAPAGPLDEAPEDLPEEVPVEEAEQPMEILEEIPVEPVAPAEAPRLEQRYVAPDCSSPCGQRRDDCCWPIDDCGRRYGRTSISLEGTFGILNGPEGLLGTPAFGFPQQFDWEELDYDGAFGGRVTLEHALAPQSWLQLRGAYYGSWDDDTTRLGVVGFQPGNAFAGGIPGGRVGASADVVGILDSEADLYGAELAYIEEFSCKGCTRWDVILGFRWLQFNEQASARFNTPPIPLFAGPSFVESDVENMFLGAQVGVRFHYQPSNAFEFTASMKALAGNLNTKVDITDRAIFAGGIHSASRETDEIVLGADIELGVRWRVTRCLAFTLGYNLMVLDGVSRAPASMDFSHSTSGAVQAGTDTDQLVWHGIFAGLTFTF